MPHESRVESQAVIATFQTKLVSIADSNAPTKEKRVDHLTLRSAMQGPRCAARRCTEGLAQEQPPR